MLNQGMTGQTGGGAGGSNDCIQYTCQPASSGRLTIALNSWDTSWHLLHLTVLLAAPDQIRAQPVATGGTAPTR